MSFMFYITSAIIFLISACAKPNYQESTSPTNTNPPSSPSVDQAPESEHKPVGQCQLIFSKEQLCVTLTWNQYPTAKDYGSFDLKFAPLRTPTAISSSAADLLPRLSVILWMPSMGHGSVPVKMAMSSESIIKINHVFFIMPGDWEIRIQLKTGSEIHDQVIYTLSI